MPQEQYSYTFPDEISIEDVRNSLFVAACAAEGVHGRSQLRLDATFRLDEEVRRCTVDATTPVGQTLARVFTELLAREFGEDAFTVERITQLAPAEMADCQCHEVAR